MYKRLFFIAVLGALLSFGSVVGAEEVVEVEENDDVRIQAGSMTPSSQTIRGGRATARWTLNWSGSGPWKVTFSADNEPFRVINRSTTATGMNHEESYSSSASYKKYTPRFMAEGSGSHFSAGSATVHKYLR